VGRSRKVSRSEMIAISNIINPPIQTAYYFMFL
jgi:hypothetical protein